MLVSIQIHGLYVDGNKTFFHKLVFSVISRDGLMICGTDGKWLCIQLLQVKTKKIKYEVLL